MLDLPDPQQSIQPSKPTGEKTEAFWQEQKRLYEYVRQLEVPPPPPSSSSGFIRPEDFDGSDQANVMLALAAGLDQGLPVQLSGSYTLTSSSTLPMTSGLLHVTGGGTLHVANDLNAVPGLTLHATYPTPVAVTGVTVESHTFPTGDSATTATRITAPGHGLAIGDVFKIVADDLISDSPDSDAFIGQFGHAADVSGDSFWMGGRLYDSYSTNVRMVRVRKEARLIWDGPGFTSVAGNVWDTIFCRVQGFVTPYIRLGARDGYSTGVDVRSCLMANVHLDVLGLKNDVDTLSFGYGVRDSCSAYSRVNGSSIDSRHFYTTSTPAATANGEPYLYGRTLGAVVSGVAMGNSSSPFDTHSEGTDVTFANCSTGNSYLGSASGGQAITLRGASNRAINCTDRNSVNGFSFIAEGDQTTRDCAFTNCRYDGAGAPFRINSSTGGGTIIRPTISGGFGRSSSTTLVQAWDCAGGVIDGLKLAPTAASGQAILLSGDAELTVQNLVVDLRDYTGSNNFRVFAFSSASTGNRLVVKSAEVINGAGKLQCWFNGSNTTGNVSLAGLDSDAVPSSGDVIQSASLDSLRLAGFPNSQLGSAAPTTGTWVQGDRVYDETPSAGGTEGWVCVSSGTPGSWKTFGSIAA